MTDQQPINQQLQQAQPVMIRDDEIDLAELFAKVWQRKWWVMATSLFCTAVALAYVLLAKPTYQLTASFRPELNNQFVALNQSGVISLNPESAFDRFRKNLESRSVRSNLFNQPEIRQGFTDQPSKLTNEQLFAQFDEALALKVPVAKKNEVLVSDANYLSFQHFDPEYGVFVVNELLAVANRQAVEELRQEYEHKRSQRIRFLEQRITDKLALAKERRGLKVEQLTEQNTLKLKNIMDKLEVVRAEARAKRFDRIEQIKEAIGIAKELGIESPTTLNRLTQQDQLPQSSQMAINTEVGDRREPLYLRGTKLLSAELQALENRQNDDFTNPEIRGLESELELTKRDREVEVLSARESDRAFIADQITPLRDEIGALQNKQVNFATMALSRIDQPAMVPEKPIKPKKRLIVAAALVLGGMLGLFIALVVPVRKKAGEGERVLCEDMGDKA